jgi:hypothetical protein
MDKWKAKTRTARNKLAEATSTGTGRGALHVPHASLAPHENASTYGVNEGYLGPQPGTQARDFATPDDQPVQQPVLEPPTSLQSSVDAGLRVPKPSKHASPASKALPRSVYKTFVKGKAQWLTHVQHAYLHSPKTKRRLDANHRIAAATTPSCRCATSQYWYSEDAIVECCAASRPSALEPALECAHASTRRRARTRADPVGANEAGAHQRRA